MENELKEIFGCEAKAIKYDSNLSLPVYMAMRDIFLAACGGVDFAIVDITKETDLSVAAVNYPPPKGSGLVTVQS
jgi:hypothetical protein